MSQSGEIYGARQKLTCACECGRPVTVAIPLAKICIDKLPDEIRHDFVRHAPGGKERAVTYLKNLAKVIDPRDKEITELKAKVAELEAKIERTIKVLKG